MRLAVHGGGDRSAVARVVRHGGGCLKVGARNLSPCLHTTTDRQRRCSPVSVRHAEPEDDPVTLEQANAIMPMTAPAGATSAEKRGLFTSGGADMYRSVSNTDRRHHYEALACAVLEQEKADAFAQESTVVISQTTISP